MMFKARCYRTISNEVSRAKKSQANCSLKELNEEISRTLGGNVDSESVLGWEAALGTVAHLATVIEGSGVISTVVGPDSDVTGSWVRGAWSTGSNDDNSTTWGVVWVVVAVTLNVLEVEISSVVALVEVVGEVVGLTPVLGRDAVVEAALPDATIADGVNVVSDVGVAHAIWPLALGVSLCLVQEVVHVIMAVAEVFFVGVGTKSESDSADKSEH